jgi:hypothetical protein
MANGYTYPIYDGTNTNPKDFAASIARMFALYMNQRDDSEMYTLREPELRVPKAQEDLNKEIVERDTFDALSGADLHVEYARAQKANKETDEKYTAKEAEAVARFKAMRQIIEGVEGPYNLPQVKQAALDQLDEAIKYHSTHVTMWKQEDFDTWLRRAKDVNERKVKYAAERLAKAIEHDATASAMHREVLAWLNRLPMTME